MIGTPEMMKKVNTNLIYQVLMELHSATRLEIADRTKISLTTVRTVLDDLLADRQIIELQRDESSGGRRAQRFALNFKKNLILSLYFEDSNVNYQIVNLNQEILETGFEHFNVENITDFIGQCMIKWDICAIGIGVPYIVENNKFYVGSKINGFIANHLGEILQNKYQIPVILENDLNAIAYGYSTQYSQKHEECTKGTINLACIHFNKSSVGAGFVVDGNILHGSGKFAGEFGFLPIAQNQTLHQVMSSLESFDHCIDAICRTLAIINCITNPALIVIGGDRFTPDSIKPEQLKAYLNRHYLAEDICPDIVVSHCYQEDYLLGLLGIKELTLCHVLPLLPLTI